MPPKGKGGKGAKGGKGKGKGSLTFSSGKGAKGGRSGSLSSIFDQLDSKRMAKKPVVATKKITPTEKRAADSKEAQKGKRGDKISAKREKVSRRLFASNLGSNFRSFFTVFLLVVCGVGSERN